MRNLRPFQIFLLAVFTFLAILAVILLRLYEPSPNNDDVQYGDRVAIWGTLPKSAFEETFNVLNQADNKFRVVRYQEIDDRTFEQELVDAIAEGRSPDLIVLPHDQLVQLRSKLYPLPAETYPPRTFKDNFIDGAEIFVRTDGTYALPFAVDPLLLYWNRDLFAAAGIAEAPTSWQAVVGDLVPRLTTRDSRRNIITSALAFGEYRNIRNADAILSMLLLQAGSRMVEEGSQGYVVAINEKAGGGRKALEAALSFYTDFSTVSSPSYTWNRAQALDRDAFVAGDLAMYFGFASEVTTIVDRNPNLNFDAARVPQGAEATARRSYGTFYGFAVPRAAANPRGGIAAATTLSNPQAAAYLAGGLNMAPVSRATIGAGTENAFSAIIYQEALIARGWLNPNPATTAGILQTMVEDVITNRRSLTDAVKDAVSRITLSF